MSRSVNRQWDLFCTAWEIAGQCEVFKNNLVVLAVDESIDTKRGSAHELAMQFGAILACVFALAGAT